MNNQLQIAVPHQDYQTWQSEIKECFGPLCLKHCFGEIDGEIPPLPVNLKDILNEESKLFPGESVGNTHRVVLMPGSLDTKDVSINLLFELTTKESSPFIVSGTGYTGFTSSKNHIRAVVESYWCLITKKPVPESNESNGFTINEKDYECLSIAEVIIAITAGILAEAPLALGHDRLSYTCTYETCTSPILNFEPIVVCVGDYELVKKEKEKKEYNIKISPGVTKLSLLSSFAVKRL